MLLSDGIHSSSFKPFGIVAIRCFKRGKHRNIARLELVRCVRRQATQFDVVSEAVYQNLELLVGAEAIADQYPWLTICTLASLRVENTCKLLQTRYRVSVTRIRKCVVPPRSRERRPIGAMGRSWPDYHRLQIPTVSAYALDYGYHLPLHSRATIVSRVVSCYEDLDGAELGKHDSGLVHIVHIFAQDILALQHLADQLEPIFNLKVDIHLVTVPVQCLDPLRLEFGVSLL
jgi:hypothetical protein